MREKIQAGLVGGLAVLVLTVLQAFGQIAVPNGSSDQHPQKKVPEHVILVKGAWSSANDSTPVPEGGSIDHNVYRNQYFGISYPLPPDWIQKYAGPPPSDSGSYVLSSDKDIASPISPVRVRPRQLRSTCSSHHCL
jgi:hypothetical protein